MSGAKSSTASATTATGSPAVQTSGRPYVGRFAPSPTGDLHLGSLLTAAASYLDSRSHAGRWLLRIEDLDRARAIPDGAGRILRSLEAFGFEWDGEVVYQSRRADLYQSALAMLESNAKTYACDCSRRELEGMDHYPGTCRNRLDPPAPPAAIRLRTHAGIESFTDRIQGACGQDVGASGDFILKRRDGIIAYALAVVIDDAEQEVSHVVRGADLLTQTGAQIFLQKRLGLARPMYAHVPVLTEPDGSKLAKSRRSVAVNIESAQYILLRIFNILGMNAPIDLRNDPLNLCWAWGVSTWRCESVPKRMSVSLTD